MSLDSTPSYPLPAELKIEAAARDLPDVLAEMESAKRFANAKPKPQHRLVLASELVDAVAAKKTHAKAAAAWAIRRLHLAGLLTAEVAIRPEQSMSVGGRRELVEECFANIEGRPFDRDATEPSTTTFSSRPLFKGDGAVPFEFLLIRSTDALWEAHRQLGQTVTDPSCTITLSFPKCLPTRPAETESTFCRLIGTIDGLYSLAMNNVRQIGPYLPSPSVIGGPSGYVRQRKAPQVEILRDLQTTIEDLRVEAERLIAEGRREAQLGGVGFETIRKDFQDVRAILTTIVTIALDPMNGRGELPLSQWATIRGNLDDYAVLDSPKPNRIPAVSATSTSDSALVAATGGKSGKISLVDLPRIRSAIHDLYRVIDVPPQSPFVPPTWWSSLPREMNLALPEGGPPMHSWLIGSTMRWVSYHLAAGSIDHREQCPAIEDSDLSVGQKAKLLELWEQLGTSSGSHQLANSKADATRFMAFLLDVLGALEDTAPVARPQGRQTSNDLHAARVIEDINAEARKYRQSLPKAESPEQESANALSVMRYYFKHVHQWAGMEEMSRQLAEKGVAPPWFSKPEWENLARSIGVDPDLPLPDIFKAAMAWATEKQNLERIRLGASRDVSTTSHLPIVASPQVIGEAISAHEEGASDELSDDEFAVLDELIQHGATGERRKRKQRDIAKGLGRREGEGGLVRTLAEMVKKGLLVSGTGRDAGYFVTQPGLAAHKKHVESARPKS